MNTLRHVGRLAVVLLGLGASQALAQTIVQPLQRLTPLSICQTATGPSQVALDVSTVRDLKTLVVEYQLVGLATTTATVQIEISCDAGKTWTVVKGTGSPENLDVTATATDQWSITPPTCIYRTDVTALVLGAGACFSSWATLGYHL